MSSSIEDPITLASELVTILASEDNNESLEKSGKLLAEHQRLCELQEISVADAIRQLTKSHQESSLEASKEFNPDHTSRIGQLNNDTAATKQEVDQIENKMSSLEKAFQENDAGVEKMKEKKAEVVNMKVDVLPKTKYYFSLFTNVSHIRWDYNSKEDEVKGFVANLDSVKPFCLDTNQNSQYFTVNYLWDLIES